MTPAGEEEQTELSREAVEEVVEAAETVIEEAAQAPPRRDPVDELWMPPGHFHSPIPDRAEIRARERELFDRTARPIPAVDMHDDEQLALLEEMRGYVGEENFVWHETEGRRYYAINDFFPYADAFFLFAMMRKFRPKRIFEVGSGFSSAVMLDTIEDHGMEIDLHFVEPNPERLHGLLRPDDHRFVRIYRRYVQDMNPDFFCALEPNDILFIDSSHVSKTGSDVNYLFFDVLPLLKPGVIVHVHDVPYPFEYAESWVYEGRSWNEIYLLRAFLAYNSAFPILLYPSYMASKDLVKGREWFPNCMDPVSCSLWMRRA